MDMTAAVLYEAGQPLRVEQVQIDEPRAGEVLVRLKATGLCHTDWTVISGERPFPLPVVLGHEGAGIVEAVGAGVTSVRPGDHVVCSWTPNCGHCFYCDEHLPFWCEELAQAAPHGVLMDGTSRLHAEGQKLHHWSSVSSHAQYTVIPESGAVRISQGVPFDSACLIGCGVMTGYGAVVRHAAVKAGSSVVVFGCGGVGLNVIQAAALVGAATIIAVDLVDQKLTWAKDFGAIHTINAKDDPLEQIRALTAGRGADYCFEAVGHPTPLVQAIEAGRPGATIVLLGAGAQDMTVTVPYNLFRGDKQITRLTYGQGIPQVDFPRIAELYSQGRLKLDELVSTRLPLAEINSGFERMLKGDIIRAVVMLD
jgi:S-(hydroxymethyl)glutathione dehydrogenase/alcohol dehydrogenase